MIDTSPINTLLEDNAATNAIRDYRRTIGSTQQARYAYNWWKVAMAILTYGDCTAVEIAIRAEEELGMRFPVANFCGLLPRVIDGTEPDQVRREYTKCLPYVARKTGLKYRHPQPGDLIDNGQGRPTKYIFYFRDPAMARAILLAKFPDMLALFMELDRIFRVG